MELILATAFLISLSVAFALHDQQLFSRQFIEGFLDSPVSCLRYFFLQWTSSLPFSRFPATARVDISLAKATLTVPMNEHDLCSSIASRTNLYLPISHQLSLALLSASSLSIAFKKPFLSFASLSSSFLSSRACRVSLSLSVSSNFCCSSAILLIAITGCS